VALPIDCALASDDARCAIKSARILLTRFEVHLMSPNMPAFDGHQLLDLGANVECRSR
jgi:hypothetical protein